MIYDFNVVVRFLLILLVRRSEFSIEVSLPRGVKLFFGRLQGTWDERRGYSIKSADLYRTNLTAFRHKKTS
jgi:hypothetical protein